MRERRHPGVTVDYEGLQRSNFRWQDHIARLLTTGALIAWLQPDTVCDPACGDGSVVEAAHRLRSIGHAWFGDISPLNIENLAVSMPHVRYVGDALTTMATVGVMDVIVLTEFLEHVEDPERILTMARLRGRALVASSPIGEPPGIDNDEHLWAFDVEAYRKMLITTGWEPTSLTEMSFTDPAFYYRYQIWTAR